MTPFAPLRDEPVGAQDHQVLRNAGVADAESPLKAVHVLFPISQLFDDSNAVRMGEDSQELCKFLGYKCMVRQGSDPLCSLVQMFEHLAVLILR